MYDHAKDKTHLLLVNVVVFNKDRVLVSQRSWQEPHEPGKWTIPGGKVERTNKEVFGVLEKTAQDEVMEETGVKVRDKIRLITNNTFVRSTGQHVVAMIFSCEYKSGKATPLEDTIDCRWANIAEVKKMQFAPNVKGYILLAFRDRLSRE
ncbi:MAG: NUDIX domain-containing protein [Patescibacteria group bacterium]